jgi:tetratricopeptide (TPR) repeat protein
VREEQNKYAEAGELIERAFAIDSSLHMRGRLASSLVARCRYADALDLIDEMLAEEPSVFTDLVALRVYSLTHLGRHDEALPILDKEIELSPNDPNKRALC